MPRVYSWTIYGILTSGPEKPIHYRIGMQWSVKKFTALLLDERSECSAAQQPAWPPLHENILTLPAGIPASMNTEGNHKSYSVHASISAYSCDEAWALSTKCERHVKHVMTFESVQTESNCWPSYFAHQHTRAHTDACMSKLKGYITGLKSNITFAENHMAQDNWSPNTLCQMVDL